MSLGYARTDRRSQTILKSLMKILISCLLIALQLVFYWIVLFEIKQIPGIYAISYIFSIYIVIHIYNSNVNSAYKLSWIIVCLLVNITGPIFYLLFGNGNNLPKRKYKKIELYLDEKLLTNDCLTEIKTVDLIGYKHAKLLHDGTGGYPLYDNTPSEFFDDGQHLFESMIEAIAVAKKFVFIEFFIIAEGELFSRLSRLLIEKSLEGVEIKIIYDAIGSGTVLKKSTVAGLNAYDNIQMLSYNPLGVNLNLGINYRDHRKIVVVDGLKAYVGGMNLADEYVHLTKRFGYWRDNGMCIEGAACYSYTLLFAQNWYMSSKQMIVAEDYKPICEVVSTKGYVLPFGDGPNNRVNPAYDLYMSLICNAQSSILISTPYFIIDKQFIYSLVKAVKSGIKVQLLVPGIPDKRNVYDVTQAHYKEILQAGGEIYEYKPGFNHAKTVIVDNKYAFIGTVNVDYRSMFLHFECGNLLIDTDSIDDMVKDFDRAVLQSEIVILERWKKRSFKKRIIAFVSTIFGPLL